MCRVFHPSFFLVRFVFAIFIFKFGMSKSFSSSNVVQPSSSPLSLQPSSPPQSLTSSTVAQDDVAVNSSLDFDNGKGKSPPSPPLLPLPSASPPPSSSSATPKTLSMLRRPGRRHRRYPSSILPDCDPRSCQPPDCACPSYQHPGNFPVSRVPMMIMLTFDDGVTSSRYAYFQRLMDQDFRNPNGCPMKMTFFVSGPNDYRLTRRLYRKGHEIASHSVTHRFPESWWARASVRQYRKEFGGQKRKLIRHAGIPRGHVRGMRVPFLNINGDNVMKTAQTNHFTYDSSCVSSHLLDSSHNALWPYTMDFVPSHDICDQSGRPIRSYPGIWEVPLIKYTCKDGGGGYMLDECHGHFGKGRPTDFANFFWRQFSHHYRTRAPMGIFTHAFFFDNEKHALRGLIQFLREVTLLEDVWLVSVGQVVDWMKEPTPTSELNDFEAWKC